MKMPRALVALALSWLTGCAAARSSDPAILKLDGQEIRRSEFDAHIMALARENPIDPALRRDLLQPFFEERVLVLEARAQGLLKGAASAVDEQAAVEALLAKEAPPVEVTDKDVTAYYEAHRDEFRHPQRVTLHQILVPTENEARDVRRRLQRDPKSFELLARTRSRSPEASTGGLMGTFEPGQLPSELESAAFSVPVGGTSEAIHSPLGYHLLRIDARSPEGTEALPESQARIRAELGRARTEQAVRAYVQQLMSRAKVNYEVALRLDRQS
jgi:hypothetical protein